MGPTDALLLSVSFISILRAAGGVARLQVVADDLPRSGEATRGGDPGTADDCRPDRLYHPLQLPLSRWSRRTQLSLLQFSQEVDSLPGPLHHSGWGGGADMGSTRNWTVELHFTQGEPQLMFCGRSVKASLIKAGTDSLSSKRPQCA